MSSPQTHPHQLPYCMDHSVNQCQSNTGRPNSAHAAALESRSRSTCWTTTRQQTFEGINFGVLGLRNLVDVHYLEHSACWYLASSRGGQMSTSSSPDGVSAGSRTARLLLRLLTLFHRMGSSVLGGAIWARPGPASPHRARRSACDSLPLDLTSGPD